MTHSCFLHILVLSTIFLHLIFCQIVLDSWNLLIVFATYTSYIWWFYGGVFGGKRTRRRLDSHHRAFDFYLRSSPACHRIVHGGVTSFNSQCLQCILIFKLLPIHIVCHADFRQLLYSGPNNLAPHDFETLPTTIILIYIWLAIFKIWQIWQRHIKIETSDCLISFFHNFTRCQVIWALV